jgi:hypothetical protein
MQRVHLLIGFVLGAAVLGGPKKGKVAALVNPFLTGRLELIALFEPKQVGR